MVLEAIQTAHVHDARLGQELTRLCLAARQPDSLRCQAMKALVVAAEPALAVASLEKLVADRAERLEVRKGACTALMLIADQAALAVTALRGVSDDLHEDPGLRKAAEAAVGVIDRH